MTNPLRKPYVGKLDHLKGRSKAQILEMVEKVVELRNIEAALLFSPMRGTEKVASARSLVMGACSAAGVPLCHIAKAFDRKWETAYSAELACSRRYRQSAKFRREWDELMGYEDDDGE